MEFFRTSVTLLSLCLFHCTSSETQSMCKDSLPPVQHVPPRSNVKVPCPVLSGSEMQYKLFKGSHEVISINLGINNTAINKNNNSLSGDFPAEFKVNADNSTNFILLSVTTNITALYTCEAIIIFPPPYGPMEHTPQTIVVVEDNIIKRPNLCQHGDLLVLSVLLGAMAAYGFIMTCVVYILRIKLGQTDNPFKRKWQGVQHPTRQGFYKETVA